MKHQTIKALAQLLFEFFLSLYNNSNTSTMEKSKRLLTTFFLSIFLLPFFASAQYTKLLDFKDTLYGSNPNYGSLISDSNFLYGMTQNGGTKNHGAIFKIKRDGTGYLILHNFTSLSNGWHPQASLVSDGLFLYGMTGYGGTSDSGIVFKIKNDSSGYTKLMDFKGPINGGIPYGSLIFDGTYLYGMTAYGGANDEGVIFKIKTDGTGYTKLLDFDGTNGSNPFGDLLSDGIFLYGMTTSGGANNLGTIFKIKSDGTGYFKVLDFAGASNGSHPNGSLISDGTFLYGMTTEGGTSQEGIIFKINTDGTSFVKLLDFTGISNGSIPEGSLITDGTYLYGMTYDDIFKIKTDGTGYSQLFTFTSSNKNGYSPYGSLFSDGKSLYGMTYMGGANNQGVLFKYTFSATGIADNFIKPNSEKLFDVYPNPSSGKFQLRISNQQLATSKEYTIEVYNLIGEKVYSTSNNKLQTSNTFDIDISIAPKGIYFIKMIDGENFYSEKIVLE